MMKQSCKWSGILAKMTCRAHAIAAVLGLSATVAAAAPARVEVRALTGEAVAPELLDTLRIHLLGAATVEAGPPLEGATLADRIAEASGALVAGGLVTWLELPPGEGGGAYVVVVVGERDGRAAVEVGRLDAGDPGAVSRLLALKVGAFLDETLAAGASSPVAAPVEAARSSPARASGAAWNALVELGGGGEGSGDGLHGAGAIAAGVARAGRGHRLEAVAVGRFGWPRRVDVATDTVTLGVVDVGAGARVLAPLGPVWLGLDGEVGARRVRAEGMAGDGARGEAVRWLARARATVDARVTLATSVTLRAAVGVERGLSIERFTVRGAPVAEIGGLAAAGELSLIVPLGRP